MTTPKSNILNGKTTQMPHQLRTTVRWLGHWCELVKLEHTIFALPFALSGLLLASQHLPSLTTLIWTILAFTGARAAAMSLNRVIDADFDSLNSRTAQRAIPQGIIKRGAALIFALISFALMLFAASRLPSLCLKLSPIAVIWLSYYSFSKRHSWFCHFALGIALGGAVLGGWIAANGSLLNAAPWTLSLAIASWVAGFDIIYSCQDIAFDQQFKLHSAPERFGLKKALNISYALHIVTIFCLVVVGFLLCLGVFYWIGLFIVALLIAWEHSLVSADDLLKVNAAFFNINGLISILCFLSILSDKLFRMMVHN